MSKNKEIPQLQQTITNISYKLPCPYDENHQSFAKMDIERDISSAIVRNIRQAQYPNSKLNEPIHSFAAFLPNNVTTATNNIFFMTNYGNDTNKVLDYNPPKNAENRIKICGKQPVVSMSSVQMRWYANTKHNNKFPMPLQTIGTNDLKKIREDKTTTFNYRHYASVVNPYYVDNPIYYTDLAEDNIEMHNRYIEKREEFAYNQFNGIIDDMNILSNEDVELGANETLEALDRMKYAKY